MRLHLVLLLILLSSVPTRAGVRAPLEGVGDLRFLADLPVFFEADGRARVDCAVRLDHAELRVADETTIDVAVALKLARRGVVAVDTTQVFRVQMPRAEGGGGIRTSFDLLEISAPAREGRWAATVELVTLDGRERRARAEGVLSVPAWPDEGPRLSDPEFRIDAGAGALPHPERLYGVSQDTLETYVEISGAPRDAESRFDLQIVDATHGTMDEQIISLRPDAPVDAAVIRLPLGALPDGHYVLRLVPAWTDQIVVESEFVVSWRIERALQARDDVLMEAELVLGPGEFARVRKMSRSAQTQYMQDFWSQLDPTPGTPRNELYERFLARVAHAARFYGEHRRPGPLTDRGKIYIRYGPPAAIDVEVIPSSAVDLDEAIGQVHDAFALDVAGTNIRGELSESGLFRTRRTDTEAARDRLREQARIGQEGSFELWRYESMGDPLFEETTVWGEDIDLRFLFVDRMGIGSYTLDYSNVSTHH